MGHIHEAEELQEAVRVQMGMPTGRGRADVLALSDRELGLHLLHLRARLDVLDGPDGLGGTREECLARLDDARETRRQLSDMLLAGGDEELTGDMLRTVETSYREVTAHIRALSVRLGQLTTADDIDAAMSGHAEAFEIERERRHIAADGHDCFNWLDTADMHEHGPHLDR